MEMYQLNFLGIESSFFLILLLRYRVKNPRKPLFVKGDNSSG